MTILALALAASNISTALSAPVHSSREVREQSLSRRDPPPSAPPPGHNPPEYYPSEESKPLLQGSSAQPVRVTVKTSQAAPPKPNVPKGSNLKQYAINFLVGTAATMAGASILKAIWSGSSSAPATSSTASTSSTSSANQNPQSQSTYPYSSTQTQTQGYGPYQGQTQGQYQGQYQNQQRDVDHGKDADFFQAKARSVLDNNRRATSHPSRADLGEVLKLFRRVLDELD